VSVRDFYDQFAPDYHLVYEDWNGAVERQGAAVDRLIRAIHKNPVDVLDCSCGIGTQAIGLARLGYRVQGTDVSERSLERARIEAARLGVDISFAACDFRDLKPVQGAFDVVVSCDNAISHLLTDDDLSRAFRAMRSKLRPGGLLLISVRDYDNAWVDRPATAVPQIHPGPPRKVVVRLHDWDGPDGLMYTLHLLVLTEGREGWKIAHHSSRLRAVGQATITRVAEDAGFAQVTWHAGADVGFHQPVMTAVNGT
jgi:glycine/sarcosine N-methyltransferase